MCLLALFGMQVEAATPPIAQVSVTHHSSRRYVVLDREFEVPLRYELLRPIGQGAYGLVVSARDTYTNQLVAIKKHSDVVRNAMDAKRTLREMRLLKFFDHENVVKLKDVYLPPSCGRNFEDVYTVSELMEGDLHQIVASNQSLSELHFQYFTYQILRALKYIHSANVLHRDLKPSNILLNSDCDLKICDFGLAREAPEKLDDLTAYVATRWYRAPEIMLSWKSYTRAVDIWSVGCVIAEILRRRPLFPGNDYMEQLHLVTDVIGTPSEADIDTIKSEKARNYVRANLMNKPACPMQQLIPSAPTALCDLLQRMLVFDPAKRITVDEALRHPYLEGLHEEEDEPECPEMFTFEYDGDTNAVDKEELRKLIWKEACEYRVNQQIAERQMAEASMAQEMDMSE